MQDLRKLDYLVVSLDFNAGYEESQEAFNLAQQTGSFEIVCTNSEHGRVVRQMVLQTPVRWCKADLIGATFNLIGNHKW